MAGMTSLLEETSKKSVQLEQIMQIMPMLSETASELREISHGMRVAELREQGMDIHFLRLREYLLTIHVHHNRAEDDRDTRLACSCLHFAET